jgi:hypothetical protein
VRNSIGYQRDVLILIFCIYCKKKQQQNCVIQNKIQKKIQKAQSQIKQTTPTSTRKQPNIANRKAERKGRRKIDRSGHTDSGCGETDKGQPGKKEGNETTKGTEQTLRYCNALIGILFFNIIFEDW